MDSDPKKPRKKDKTKKQDEPGKYGSGFLSSLSSPSLATS
jgi:hypothetical protein